MKLHRMVLRNYRGIAHREIEFPDHGVVVVCGASDVGSEVTAEISCGTYRFIYRKRFHKKCETELTVLEPRREQLTGDEAHERVQAMLAETVDNDLWHAQR